MYTCITCKYPNTVNIGGQSSYLTTYDQVYLGHL